MKKLKLAASDGQSGCRDRGEDGDSQVCLQSLLSKCKEILLSLPERELRSCGASDKWLEVKLMTRVGTKGMQELRRGRGVSH